MIDIVFNDKHPNKLEFVEVEDGYGRSIKVGEWSHRPGGFSVLRLTEADLPRGPRELPADLHPAVASLLLYFEFSHLPENLQAISRPLSDIAWEMVSNGELNGAELTVGLRKLLEAKDCFVRAAL